MQPFATFLEVPGLNTTVHDGDPDLAGDGCSLYFASTRDGVSSIYVAEVVR